MRKRDTTCAIDGCDEPVYCRGLCSTCYAWDYYHTTRGHGAPYMLEYRRKAERNVARASARIGRRRSTLRAV